MGYFNGQQNMNGTTAEIQTNKQREQNPSLTICVRTLAGPILAENSVNINFANLATDIVLIFSPGVLNSTMLSGFGPVSFSP